MPSVDGDQVLPDPIRKHAHGVRREHDAIGCQSFCQNCLLVPAFKRSNGLPDQTFRVSGPILVQQKARPRIIDIGNVFYVFEIREKIPGAIEMLVSIFMTANAVIQVTEIVFD